jgi:hypothetical protein
MSIISRATQQIKDQAKETFRDFLLTTFIGDEYPQQNILHNYRTFNYNITLAVVSKEEFKKGTYRTVGLDYPIFQSHGKPINGAPIVRNGSKKLEDFQNFLGSINNLKDNKWDFYLQDLYIRSAFTAKRDIGSEFRLKIVEPYGMDTFYRSILEGLRVKGYADFGKGNAFILKIEFVGYRDDKDTPEIIPFSTRYYPLIISNLSSEVTQEGTVYELHGSPLNDTGRFSDVNVIPQDFSISGNTVKELLTGKDGLTAFLNQTLKKEKLDSNFIPHEYAIEFLNEEGRSVDNGGKIISKILSSKMYNPNLNEGSRSFSTPTTQYISAVSLDQTIVENKDVRFNVSGKYGIAKIIDSIIAESYYAKDMILRKFQGDFLEDGMLPWWRISTRIELIEFDTAKNLPVLKIVYLVAPRKVSYTKLASIFFPNTQADPEDYEKFCTRRYEWNYTGNNRDILSFRINYDALNVRLFSANLGKMSKEPGENVPAQGSEIQTTIIKPNKEAKTSPDDNASNKSMENVDQRIDGVITNSLTATPEANIARDINAMLNSPQYNVNMEMEILGDPMWLGTQFIDNQSFVDINKSDLYTSDGGIAMRTIDPCVRVIAYAPSDINSEGFLAPSSNVDQNKRVSDFSAYYNVYEIESFFSNGIFKQKIKGYRDAKTDMKKASEIASDVDIFGFKRIGAVK